ncbi:hypothetical protein ACFVHQ_13405 [Actinomycetes bacterium NPDC127524]
MNGNLLLETLESGKQTLGRGTLNGNLTVNTPNISFINNANVLGKTTIMDIANSTFTNDGSLQDVEILDENGSRFINNSSADKVGEVTINTDQPVTLGGDLESVKIDKSTSVVVESGTINQIKADSNLEIEISLLNEAKAKVMNKPQSVAFKQISSTDLENLVNARVQLAAFENAVQTDLSNKVNLDNAIVLNRKAINVLVILPDGIEKRHLFTRYDKSYNFFCKAQITPEDTKAVSDAINNFKLTVSNPDTSQADIQLPQIPNDQPGLEVIWTNYDDNQITADSIAVPERPTTEGLIRTVILRVDVNHGYAHDEKFYAIKIPFGNGTVTVEEIKSFTKKDSISSELFSFSGDYEVAYKSGSTVGQLTQSGLFGKDAVQVISKSNDDHINQNQLMTLDTQNSSFIYSIQDDETLSAGQTDVQGNENGLFKVDYNDKVIYYKGIVASDDLKTYLNQNNPFNDGFLIIDFYKIESDTSLLSSTMRVLEVNGENHALYSFKECINQ